MAIDATTGSASGASLTTQQPGQPPVVRPVPPSWATVAPLLERWQIALAPHRDGTWDVVAFHTGIGPPHDARQVPFARLPQTIADLAAQCEAAPG
jgi:hypothetical protein